MPLSGHARQRTYQNSSTLIFVVLTVAMTTLLTFGLARFLHATGLAESGLPPSVIVGAPVLVGVLLAIPRQTRLFGLALLSSMVIFGFVVLVTINQIGS